MTDKLILASSSPRRVELLTECRIKFETVNHNFDENSVNEKNPVKLAEILSLGKAQSVALKNDYYDKYVLGVDTIVVYKNQILGKPGDRAEADKFIRLLSNKTHKVISGISLVNSLKSFKMVKSSISKVTFVKFDEKFIKYYLDNNLWAGYAGGYAIQSLFSLFAKKIQGSYSNIVGLPVDVLYKMLKSINFNFLW
jgi:septum formation protein